MSAQPLAQRAPSTAKKLSGYSLHIVITAYLLFLCWQIVSTFSGNVSLPWYSKSDETVIAAEVIRFSNGDFHQHFYDMPGTPLMLFGAAQWTFFDWWSVLTHDVKGSMNQFSFQHLQQLLVLLRADNVFFYLLSAVLLFWIVSRSANACAGAAAATILLMNSAYAETGASLRVEPLAMCFMLGGVLVLTECSWRSAPFWAGALGGLAAACRVHSITATLPILLLLLFKQTWGKQASYSPGFRRLAASVAVLLVIASALLFYYFGPAPNPLKASYALAFALFAKTSVMLGAVTIVLVLLYSYGRSRIAVVNTITPKFFGMIGGLALGFVTGTPTVFRQYEALLRSLNFYLGPVYRDAVAMHYSLGKQIVTFLSFYFKIIAPDFVVLVLLVSGAGLILCSQRWRPLWPYLVVGISFFFSKPVDLVRGEHHIAMWVPFYAIVCVVPIAALYEALKKHGQAWRYSTALFAAVTLMSLHAELRNGPANLAEQAAQRSERLHNVDLSRSWIKANTKKDSSFMIAFSCFGPEVFYSWFKSMGLDVPNTTNDGREYIIWWGFQSALKGRSGFACLARSDVPFMQQLELRQVGEGLDPLHDNRFHVLQSFGHGSNQVFLLWFDFSNVGDSRPTGLTFPMRSAARLDSITAYDQAIIKGKSPVLVTTRLEPWSYAALIPLFVDRAAGGKAWMHIRARTVTGNVGVGILDRASDTLRSEELVKPSTQVKDIYIELPSEGHADGLMIRNASTKDVRSQMAIEDVEILARAHRVEGVARFEEIQSAYTKASIIREPHLTITTAPEQWTFAAAIPIHAATTARGLVLKIRAQTLSGEVSFSILSQKTHSIQFEQSFGKSDEPIDVFVPVPQVDGPASVLIRDTAPSGTLSSTVLSGIETWQID